MPQTIYYATIFDIQRFSIHDGPGIRTTLFFKGCPLRCAWCQNPESQHPDPEILFFKESCLGCLDCGKVCQQQAILPGPDDRIDFNKCTHCGLCVNICQTRSLRMAGTKWQAKDLIQEIIKDCDFFADSGGGLTLSGGEPMLHHDFFKSFLPKIKSRGIHVNLETCGYFQFKTIAWMLPYLDLIYFDLKHMDPEIHKKYTGVDNQRILNTFKTIAGKFKHLQARMPVIPMINDSPENIKATAAFLKHNQQRSIHCLPYHRLGEAKKNRMKNRNKPNPVRIDPLQIDADLQNRLKSVCNRFKKEGIDVVLYNPIQ